MQPATGVLACAVAAILLGGDLAAQEDRNGPPNERRLRVLALLEREARRGDSVVGPNRYLNEVIFVGLRRRATGPPDCLPFPAVEPRPRRVALASELFAIYGLTMKPDYVLEVPGAKARLEGFDPKAKIGFMMGPSAVRWEDRRRAAEKFSESGYPVRLMPDGSGWTSGYSFVVALAAPLTEFLDSVTEGHDVALQTALETSYTYNLQDVRWPAGVEIDSPGGAYRVHTRLATAVQIRIDRKRVAQRVSRTAKKPERDLASTRGRRVIIGTRLGPWQQKELHPLPVVTVSQDVADDTLHVAARNGLAIMPPAFDAAEPYWVTIEFPAGTYFWNARLTVHAPE